MHFAESPSGSPPPETPGAERRRKPRITHPFLCTVCAISSEGTLFKSMTIVDDLSAGGLHLCLRQKLEAGASVLIVVHLAGLPEGDAVPHVFFEGEVWRVESLPQGGYGYGVSAKRCRLRYLKFVNDHAAKSFLGSRAQESDPARRRA